MADALPDLVGPDTSVDATLWVRAAQQSVRTYCGWHIAPSIESTLTLDPPGTGLLILPSLHVTGVSSIMVDGVEMVGQADWSAKGMVRLRHGVFPERFGSVEVTMRHGWGPEEVTDVISLILKIAQRAASGASVIASQSANGSSVTYMAAGGAPLSTPLLQIEREALRPYRLEWVV